MISTVVSKSASPDFPIIDIPKSVKDQPMYWGFLLHLYMPVVISVEESKPFILLRERNSIIPANVMVSPIPIAPIPAINAILLLRGKGQMLFNDADSTNRKWLVYTIPMVTTMRMGSIFLFL